MHRTTWTDARDTTHHAHDTSPAIDQLRDGIVPLQVCAVVNDIAGGVIVVPLRKQSGEQAATGHRVRQGQRQHVLQPI
jgi:hypothetical protein